MNTLPHSGRLWDKGLGMGDCTRIFTQNSEPHISKLEKKFSSEAGGWRNWLVKIRLNMWVLSLRIPSRGYPWVVSKPWGVFVVSHFFKLRMAGNFLMLAVFQDYRAQVKLDIWSGLKQHTLIIWRFWMPEVGHGCCWVKIQVLAGLCSLLGVPGRDLFSLVLKLLGAAGFLRTVAPSSPQTQPWLMEFFLPWITLTLPFHVSLSPG